MKKLFSVISLLMVLHLSTFAQGKITGTGFNYHSGDSIINLEYSLSLAVNKDMSGSFIISGIKELEGVPVTFEKFSFESNEIYAAAHQPWGYKELNVFNFQYPKFEKSEICIFHFDFIPLKNKYEIKIMDGVKVLYTFDIHVLNFDEWDGPLFFKRTFDFSKVDIYDLKVDEYLLDTTFHIGYHVEITDKEFVFTNNIEGIAPATMKIYSLFIADNGFELFFFHNNDRIMMPNETPIPEIAFSVEYDKDRKTYQQIHMITD